MATIIQLGIGRVAPTSLTPRTMRASYEAGATSRRTAGWRAPTTDPNSAVLGNLAMLRDRSRNADRNQGYAKGAIDALVRNIIGTGIVPRSTAPDATWRTMVHAAFLRWTDESDAEGRLDFYGQQGQAVRAWLTGGESFTRLRPRLPEDGLVVPLQLQILEPEMCPHGHTVTAGAARVRAGIEFGPIGQRTAYWFHPYRPEDPTGIDTAALRRVPAESVAHLYLPERPGQLRGIPRLTPALIALHELDKYDDAQLIRQQLANMFVGFLKTPSASGDAATLHPMTDAPVETINDTAAIQFEPGLIQELRHGEEMQFSDPPDPNGYTDFMRQQLANIAAATGVPYELISGDLSKVNDRTVRVVLHEFRRGVQALQHQIVVFQWCRPIWRAWLQRAMLAGAVPMPTGYARDPEPWLSVEWKPQAWPYINPVQDVEAKRSAIRAGLSSRAAEVAEQGEDAEAIDRANADDNARADALGLVYDSDPRRVTSAGTSQAAYQPQGVTA